jgi:hypothetical protein
LFDAAQLVEQIDPPLVQLIVARAARPMLDIVYFPLKLLLTLDEKLMLVDC